LTLHTHSIAYRPWGTFETLIDDNGYKIKRIVVKPQKDSLYKNIFTEANIGL